MRWDAIVAGGGPAGSVAAAVLARGGARVLVLERARYPRHKLCGDTVNPGAVAILRRLRLDESLEGGLPLDGMFVTGDPAVRVAGAYPGGVHGVSIGRDVFDERLARLASRAGAAVEEAVLVTGPHLAADGSVDGVEVARSRGGRRDLLAARIVIAADGHFSRVARPLRLSRSGRGPRRWALGGYFTGVQDLARRGEMHVRRGHYLGIAPMPDGRANVCLVTAAVQRLRAADPLAAAIAGEPDLRRRFARARRDGAVVTLGPLAVDAPAAGMRGLLLAGDAAGFIDPITGDGTRFAIRGGELAALAALEALERGGADAHLRLLAQRQAEFAGKWRFNRVLRALVAQPAALRLAGAGAALAPAVLRRVIRYAGDAA